ncbi:hypothetical protein [Anaerophaga thermohalophila]|nr:hypothetical protein [Anaerophaga thermohalophila]
MGGDYFEKPEGLDLDIPGRVGLAGATLYLRSFFIFSGLRYGMVLV